MVGIVIVFAISVVIMFVMPMNLICLVMTVAVLGIVADSIDDNCDGDISGNIICCIDYYGGVTGLYSCAVYCMNCLSI